MKFQINELNINLPSIYTQQGGDFFWQYLREDREFREKNPARPEELLDERIYEFLIFCLQNYRSSTAIKFEDLYVLFKTQIKQGGYFVEFGACNGYAMSNTYLLETNFGWNGILAEPNDDWHEDLARVRRCHVDHRCVWSESGKTLKFTIPDMMGVATISEFKSLDRCAEIREQGAREIEVTTVSLNDLLDEKGAPAEFDYLSVDTEGSEYEILKRLDFNRYRPRLITVEHNHHAELRNNLFTLLSAQGYVREWERLSDADDWYCVPEIAG